LFLVSLYQYRWCRHGREGPDSWIRPPPVPCRFYPKEHYGFSEISLRENNSHFKIIGSETSARCRPKPQIVDISCTNIVYKSYVDIHVYIKKKKTSLQIIRLFIFYFERSKECTGFLQWYVFSLPVTTFSCNIILRMIFTRVTHLVGILFDMFFNFLKHKGHPSTEQYSTNCKNKIFNISVSDAVDFRI